MCSREDRSQFNYRNVRFAYRILLQENRSMAYFGRVDSGSNALPVRNAMNHDLSLTGQLRLFAGCGVGMTFTLISASAFMPPQLFMELCTSGWASDWRGMVAMAGMVTVPAAMGALPTFRRVDFRWRDMVPALSGGLAMTGWCLLAARPLASGPTSAAAAMALPMLAAMAAGQIAGIAVLLGLRRVREGGVRA
jgi:hypothetical protein